MKNKTQHLENRLRDLEKQVEEMQKTLDKLDSRTVRFVRLVGDRKLGGN